MSDRVKHIKRFTYLEGFSCIGGACEDTCCIGWDVDIDQRTFESYEGVRESEVAEDLHLLVKRNPVSSDPGIDFARVVLKSGKRCPFLDADRLCRIQSALGEKALSNVCAGFPRFYNQVGDTLEETATLSCPEIARKVLLGNQVSQPGQSPLVLNSIPIKTFERSPERVIVGRKIKESVILNKTREMLHHVIESPYTLYGALVIIGSHLQHVSQSLKSNDVSAFLKYHEAFMEGLCTKDSTIGCPSLQSMGEEHLLSPDLQGITLMDFYHQKLKVGIDVKDERFMGLCTRSLEAFGKKKGVQPKAYHRQFIDLYGKYGRSAIEARNQTMKNEMIHHFFKTLYPLAEGADAETAYKLIVVREAWLSWLMTGLAGASATGNVDDQDFVWLYQSYCKVIEHHKSFLDDVARHLELMGNVPPSKFARFTALKGPMG